MFDAKTTSLLSELRDMIADCRRQPDNAELLKQCADRIDGALAEENGGAAGIDFKEILDELPFGVGIVAGDGLFLYINRACAEETGLQPELVLNRYVQDIAKEGIYFRNPCSMHVLKSGRKVSTVSTDNAYGKHKIAYTVGIPLFDQDGEIRYAVTSMLNTEIMRTYYNEFRNSQKESASIRIIENTHVSEEGLMVGTNKNMEKIRRLVEKAAPTDATVLIVGESGVGKELVADYVYECSSRRGKPYVKINCTAIPDNLLESELFGYEKGAFTGASGKGKVGLLEIADGGTVLLDEIGELPLDLQPKLLRFLQQGTIYRIGGSTPKKLDVRIIAATNANLKENVKEGKFRDDLYYRLSVFPISVPPLRMRTEDIRKIAEYYFQVYCKKYEKTVIVPEVLYQAFEGYDWPGNVRELQNIVEYLVICCDPDEEIDPILLQSMFSQDSFAHMLLSDTSLYEMRCQFEREVIIKALRQFTSLRETAKVLGLAPSSLLRKTQKYGLDVQELLKNKGEK